MRHFLIWLVVFVFMTSCSGGSGGEKTGSEGGPCYPNDTCDNGLTCLNDKCVNPNADSDTFLTDDDNDYFKDDSCPDIDNSNPDDNEQFDAPIIFPHDKDTDFAYSDDDADYYDDDAFLFDTDSLFPDDSLTSDEEALPLQWLDKTSSMMNWTDAAIYCTGLGGRLPTISELRTLIQSCPATETEGVCGVTDECLASLSCYSASCEGCTTASDGKYSVLGDIGWLWSSSADASGTDQAWPVNFSTGGIHSYNKASLLNIRCVR